MASAPRWILALSSLALAAGGAHATMLYKSIGPHGVIEFSDTPPDHGTIIETRVLSDATTQVAMADALADPAVDDAEVARASTEVDLAEHALALARRPLWSPRAYLRLDNTTRSSDDTQRIQYYERQLRVARHALFEALKIRPR